MRLPRVTFKAQEFIIWTLFCTAILMVGVILYLFFVRVVIYRGYSIELEPNQTFVVGDAVPYIASGYKTQDILGVVNRYLDCYPGTNTFGNRVTITVETTATNSSIGPYRLFNKTFTVHAAEDKRLTLPATCQIRNTVIFKPNVFHPAVSYTAMSSYRDSFGKEHPSYFKLINKP